MLVGKMVSRVSMFETFHCRCYLLDTVFPESIRLYSSNLFFFCVLFCDSVSLSVNWQQPVK